ncbi:MAG: PD40 domain-containing protein [Bdellovibrionales bacterium]|nr:translocation protein TolB [Bdellovibrionales bacterium]NQZ18564.1 PD40 domain-containing protein [Bdellovibrionales bacterium]
MKIIILSLIVFLSMSAQAAVEQPLINIGEAEVKQSPMAIVPLKYLGTPALASKHLAYGKRLYDIIQKDLKISSYFSFISPEAFIEDYRAKSLTPKESDPAKGFDFSSWKQIGAEFMIRSGFKVVKNQMTYEAYLYHVPRRKLLLGKSYSGAVNDLRTIAHKFSNDIMLALTGKNGFFMTKFIVARSTKNYEKEIFIMDWDGSNQQQITKHRTISQSPAWSPDGRYMSYTSFLYHKKTKTRNADLYLFDFKTRKRFLLSYQRGINSGATFAPDSGSIFFRISNRGASDIYRTSLDGKRITPITKGPRGAMNVEPAISPDGKKVAFSSDRSGQPMIYTMDVSGKNVKRLTFAGRYNSSPAWSPDGKRIAFAGFDKGHFDIFVVDANGKHLKRLTTAKKRNGKLANNEYPSFSPDGRFILFSSDRSGKYQLYIVSIDGKYEHRLTFDNKEYFKPQWSPYLN